MRDVPNPRDSYSMLGALGAIIDHVAQACDQLAGWHSRVEDGTHYEGEDGGTEGSARAVAVEVPIRSGSFRVDLPFIKPDTVQPK